ncbi:MAG: alpha/beta fold hydrolase [Paracoccaceae bacterium]
MPFRFASCSLDPERHEFRRADELVRLEPQVFDLLFALVQSHGDLVSRERLIETVWRGVNVSDATISARINAARAAVGDTGKDQRIIRTVPRRGYQLAVPVEADADADQGGAAHTPEARQVVRFTHSADGLRIAYARSGSGPPLVRVGHWLTHLELDWHSPVWRPLLDVLGARHTLYRYDQRGTGLSGRKAGGMRLEDFVADLKAVADAAGLDRFPIFAASQASPVALRFAAEHPDRVSRIILLGAYAEGRAFRAPSPNEADEETVLALIRSGWGRRGSPFVRAFSSLFMPDATTEQIRHFVQVQLESASPETAVLLRQAVDRFSVTDILAQVRAPVLVIHARGDVIHPISQGRLLASELPDARFVMLDSDNHVPLPQHQSWPEMVEEINAFLDEDPAVQLTRPGV